MTSEQRGKDERIGPTQLYVAAWIVTLLLVTHALYFASSLFVPLTMALLAYLAMRPVVRRMTRTGLPAWVAAGAVTLLFGGVAIVTAMLVAQPAQYWTKKVPASLSTIGPKLATLKRPLEIFDTAEAQIVELTETDSVDAPLRVEVATPSIIDKEVIFSGTSHLLVFLLAVGVTSFFLLASDDDLLRRLMRSLPTLSDRKKAYSIVLEIQDMVGSYLLQITLINFGLGCSVALMTWACGMPTPLLWGVMAMLLNYIPFVGAFIGAGILFLASAIEYDQLWSSISVTFLYLILTSVEANFITPTILGRTMKLGTLMVLIACAFWGFLWGLPGVIVAVPMLIVVRLVCANFRTTRPIAIMLGDDSFLESDADRNDASKTDASKNDEQSGQVVPAPKFRSESPVSAVVG